MPDTMLSALRLATAIACGLMAGLFFAFSTAVMGALGRLPPAEGIAVMQAINRVILNPLFLAVFIVTPAACTLIILTSLWRWSEPGGGWLICGGALYIAGAFAVTALVNVPMNNALDAVSPAGAEANALWSRYLQHWTAWNHVRTAAALAGAALLAFGHYVGGGSGR